MSLLDLPPAAEGSDPVILPGLLSGLGILPRRVPAWITDPNVIASIQCGLYDLPDEFAGEQ